MRNCRVVMLAGPGEMAPTLYHQLSARFGHVPVIMEERVSRVAFVRRRARRLGWTTVGNQILFKLAVLPVLRLEASERLEELQKSPEFCFDPIPKDHLTHVSSVNSEQARAALRELEPEVVVISGTRIVSKATLQCVNAPFVNLHTGITPQYRGVHGGYWALHQNDHHNFGVTVHLVDVGIDTGNILAQQVIKPSGKDNFATYPYLQFVHGVPMVVSAVESLLAGERRQSEASNISGKLWSHPTATSYLRARRRGVR